MNERMPGFGPVPGAEDFAADILPEVPKDTSPVENIEKIPFAEAIIGRVIESAAGVNPLEQTLDQAREGVVNQQGQQGSGNKPLSSVGEILSQQHVPGNANSAVNPSLLQQGPSTQLTNYVPQTTSLTNISYRRAIRLGFLTAVTSVIVVGLFLVFA